MTEDQQTILVALDKFGGDRQLAAAALGKELHAVECQIATCDELKQKHGRRSVPPQTQAEAMHRPNGNGEDRIKLEPHDRDLVISMVKEDKLLAEGLERLGLKPEEVKRAIAMRDFSKNQFVESVQIVGSSMTTICVLLGTQVGKVIDRLEAVRKKIDDNVSALSRTALVEEEKYLSESLIGMSEQVRRMSDTAHRGMMLQAMIKFRLMGARGGMLKQQIKPGFGTEIPVDSRIMNQSK